MVTEQVIVGSLESDDDGYRARRIHGGTVAVLLAGLALTLAVVVATQAAFESNEDRLLQQRTREAAAVLTAALPGIQTPLASAAQVAEQDGGDQVSFTRIMSALVTSGGPYVSASLWRADTDTLRPLVVVGGAPKLVTQPPPIIRQFLDQASAAQGLAVIGLLDGDNPRLGYSYTSLIGEARYVAYAEGALPADRTSVVPADSAFADLDYAVYLGERENPTALLASSTAKLPLQGRREDEAVAFGDTSLLLVMAPTTHLAGDLLATLPWLVAAVGLLTTLGATLLNERLLRRGDQANSLAATNRELYTKQLSVARTLQHSLLPQQLPAVAGLQVAARYIPGVAGLDIGGDWYDVVELAENRILIAVGDVSGRGLEAGTAMASLRFAIRAFASRGDEPSTILTSLTRLLDVEQDGHFATVLCAMIDVPERVITIANAGHPSPLLIDDAAVTYLPTEVGPPIGVTRDVRYAAMTHRLHEGSTLVIFTDGLFERRGETVDEGLERLRRAVPTGAHTLEEVFDCLLSIQTNHETHDDGAILGVRWKTNRPKP
jgi:serine phosphatase RsbU (regulator of sigma subunit)